MGANNDPIAGKLGRFKTVVGGTTVDVKLSEWSLDDKANLIPNNHFNMSASADGNIRTDVLPGMVTSTLTFSGLVDADDIIPVRLPPGTLLKGSNSVLFGYTNALLFTGKGTYEGSVTGTTAEGAATVSGTFQLSDITYPA